MKNCVKGSWCACIPTVGGHYDLILKNGGDSLAIFALTREELIQAFTNSGSSLFLTIKLFDDEPADAVIDA